MITSLKVYTISVAAMLTARFQVEMFNCIRDIYRPIAQMQRLFDRLLKCICDTKKNVMSLNKCLSIVGMLWNVIDMQSVQLCGITLPENSSIMLNGQSESLNS